MMDGFQGASGVGILYAEDFGIEVVAPPPPPPEPEGPPPLTQADIDAACAAAVRAAEAAWAGNAQERRARAIESMAAQLDQARQAAERQVETMAEALSRTALGMVAGVLPQLSQRFGDAEVRALLSRLLPVLGRSKRVIVRVHAGLLEPLRTDLEQMADGLADLIELRPANLAPGDARLSWEEGSLTRDGTAICAAVTDALTEFGLLEAAPATLEKRSFALAEH